MSAENDGRGAAVWAIFQIKQSATIPLLFFLSNIKNFL